MTRNGPSALAKFVVGELASNDMVFDWGCGKGVDVAFYLTKVDTACGWDPHYLPHAHPNILKGCFNVVTCSHVLNVLELEERKKCVEAIADFISPGGTAYFAVRSKKDIDTVVKKSWEKKDDGWITSIGTFQHGFTSNELTKLLSTCFENVECVNKTPLIVKCKN